METKGCTFLLLIGLVITAIGSIVGGWVLSVLWAWFIAPFFGLPAISIAQACGVSLVIGLMTKEGYSKNNDQGVSEMIAAGISNAVFVPLFSLGIGWVFKLFL